MSDEQGELALYARCEANPSLPTATLFPYTTLFRSQEARHIGPKNLRQLGDGGQCPSSRRAPKEQDDRNSAKLNEADNDRQEEPTNRTASNKGRQLSFEDLSREKRPGDLVAANPL